MDGVEASCFSCSLLDNHPTVPRRADQLFLSPAERLEKDGGGRDRRTSAAALRRLIVRSGRRRGRRAGRRCTRREVCVDGGIWISAMMKDEGGIWRDELPDADGTSANSNKVTTLKAP